MDMTEHSLWISTVPVTVNGKSGDVYTYTIPSDDKFMYLGSGGLSISNTYDGSVTGIYGKGFENAYYVDSALGVVTKFNVNTRRVQPLTPDDTSSSYHEISNAKFLTTLRKMKQTRQLLQGAYILRIYNITQKESARGVPYDIPVFLEAYDSKFNLEHPNDVSVTLRFIKRSPLDSVTTGHTVYG